MPKATLRKFFVGDTFHTIIQDLIKDKAKYFDIEKYVKDGKPQIWGRIALMFVTGGALGNNIDRLFLFNDPNIPCHHAVDDLKEK